MGRRKNPSMKIKPGRPISIWHYQVIYPDGGRGAVFLHRKEAAEFIESQRLIAIQRADFYTRCGVEKLKAVVDSAAYRRVNPEMAHSKGSVFQ